MTGWTLVMAYYENAGMLQRHLETWAGFSKEIRDLLNVVVVDDGSPNAPALDAIRGHEEILDYLGPGGFQLWRMGKDVRWNQDACRNIGVHQSVTRWVLLTDMDHVVPEKTWAHLMTAKLKKERAYRFARVNAPNLDPYKPHPNSWALTRDLYWYAGGYDEALAGLYGTDGDFKVRLNRCAEIHDLPVPIIRYPREVIPDASTTTLQRKDQGDSDEIKRRIKARADNPQWKPLHFSFPCTRLL